MKRISEEKERCIIENYENGLSIRDNAADVGADKNTILDRIKKYKEKLRQESLKSDNPPQSNNHQAPKNGKNFPIQESSNFINQVENTLQSPYFQPRVQESSINDERRLEEQGEILLFQEWDRTIKEDINRLNKLQHLMDRYNEFDRKIKSRSTES